MIMEEKLLLKMEDIRKSFLGVEVLKGIHFELKSGEIVSLAGTNGAGKSTTLNMVAGVYPIDQGTIILDGKDISDLPEYNIFSAQECPFCKAHRKIDALSKSHGYTKL